MKNNVKIYLADDHILLRDALVSLINTFPECRVVSVAANGKQLIKSFEKGIQADIVILDLNMPEMDGYVTAEWLKANRPEVKILILTMYDSEIAMIRLLQTGVRGFLKKDIHPNDLRTAIVSVANNGYYYCNASTGKIAAFFQRDVKGETGIDKGLLSELEISFLKLASSDLTYKEIASEMKMSVRTIDAYRDGLFDKLGVRSRVGLVIYAMKNGIVVF